MEHFITNFGGFSKTTRDRVVKKMWEKYAATDDSVLKINGCEDCEYFRIQTKMLPSVVFDSEYVFYGEADGGFAFYRNDHSDDWTLFVGGFIDQALTVLEEFGIREQVEYQNSSFFHCYSNDNIKSWSQLTAKQ